MDSRGFVKRVIWIIVPSILFLGHAAQASVSLPHGFGKARWEMTPPEFLKAYQLALTLPKSARPEGIWAVEGPSPGEITVSGAGLGDEAIRSASFGFHPTHGLAIIHVRFKERPSALPLEKVLPAWTDRYGPPKERQPDKFVWEDGGTHIELTFHLVSESHPSPSDHLAIVLWSIPIREKIDAEQESNDERR
jgi:hypothetical protein